MIECTAYTQRVNDERLCIRIAVQTTVPLRAVCPRLQFVDAHKQDAKGRRVVVETSAGHAAAKYDGVRRRALLERTVALPRAAQLDISVTLDTSAGGRTPTNALFTLTGSTDPAEAGNDGSVCVHLYRELQIVFDAARS